MSPALIGLIITVVSTAVSAAVQHQNNKAMEDQQELNAKREREEAEARAEQERLTRLAESREEARQSAHRKARLKAKAATDGIELTGTPMQLIEEQAGYDEYNIMQRDQDSLQRRKNMIRGGQIAYAQGMGQARAYGTAARNSLITGTAQTASNATTYSSQRGWLD